MNSLEDQIKNRAPKHRRLRFFPQALSFMMVFSQLGPPAHKNAPMPDQDYSLSCKLLPSEQKQDVQLILPLASEV